MPLSVEPSEDVVYDGRMSWIAAFATWKAIITLGIWGFVRRLGSRYTITDDRVYRRFGLLSKDEDIVRIEDVQDFGLDQGIMGRFLGYGNVKISTAGRSGTEITFRGVGSPGHVRSALDDALADARE